MSIRCTGTDPGGGQCPWETVAGEGLCGFHLEVQRSAMFRQEVDQIRQQSDRQRDERIQMRRRAAQLRAETRQLIDHFAANMPELERKSREAEAKAKQARKDAWHARRREQEAKRRADAAEARKAAQIAAQDPATRQTCRVCGRSLPLEAFPRNRAALLGRMTRCRDCQREYDRERRSKR